MKLLISLSFKFLWKKSFWGNISTILSLVGLCLGSVCLIVTLSLINGYEYSLKKSVYDVSGHLIVDKLGRPIFDNQKFKNEFSEVFDPKDIVEEVPFVLREGLVAKEGQVRGVVLQLQAASKSGALFSRLNKKIIKGKNLSTDPESENVGILVGAGLAKSLKLEIGEVFPFILPYVSESGDISRKLQKFELVGILDLGQHDLNHRFVFSDLNPLVEFSGFSLNQSTGVRYFFKDPNKALIYQSKIQKLKGFFSARTWKDAHRTLFHAIEYEKQILFIVLSLMLLIASFNAASSMFLNLMNHTKQFSLLKSIGLSSFKVNIICLIQAVILAAVGSLLGVVISLAIISGLGALLKGGYIIPPVVYKLSQINLVVEFGDVFLVFLMSVFVALLASIGPIRMASKIKPVEGLKYE